VLNLPVHLDADLRDYLAERAKAKGVNLGRQVSDLLGRDIGLTKAAK